MAEGENIDGTDQLPPPHTLLNHICYLHIDSDYSIAVFLLYIFMFKQLF